MSGPDTKELIQQALANFVKEVPALQKLKLTFALELKGRGDVQLYLIKVPGPEITKVEAANTAITLELPRSHFNELAKDGKLKHWREAFEKGSATVDGTSEVIELVKRVVQRHESRAATPKAKKRDH